MKKWVIIVAVIFLHAVRSITILGMDFHRSDYMDIQPIDKNSLIKLRVHLIITRIIVDSKSKTTVQIVDSLKYLCCPEHEDLRNILTTYITEKRYNEQKKAGDQFRAILNYFQCYDLGLPFDLFLV